MDNFDLKKYLVENKVTTNSRMINEASTEALEGIADVIANYSTEDPKDAADTVGEMALEFLEGEAVPEGMFNSKMRAGIANVLRQHSSRRMSGMEAAKKLVELLKDPANYEEGGTGQEGVKVGSAEGADISVGEESSLQDTQYYIITVGGKSQTVSVEVAGEPVTLQQVTSETGLSPKKAQIIVKHINSQLRLTENKVTRNSRMLKENIEASPEAVSTYVNLLKNKFGDKLGQFIEDELYDSMNMSYFTLPAEWNDKELAKWAKMDLEWNASEGGEETIDVDFAKDLFNSNLKLYGVEDYL
jgi:hypothetical protein